MHFNVSTKGFKLSDKDLQDIEIHVKKIAKFLPQFQLNPDLTKMDLVIRKNKERGLNHKGKDLETVNESVHITTKNPKIPSQVYYDGTIKLILPKKPLVVHVLGSTIDEAVNKGFKKLRKELETYEGFHSPNYSEYFDHSTLQNILEKKEKRKE